ncbi:MAG: rhomboid family intramembrane serine protease [Bacteroidota bacterium]
MFKNGWWYIPAYYIVAMWIAFFLQDRLGLVQMLALYPKDYTHLLGIITTPFLHQNLSHITSNTLPLAVCLFCLFYFYRDISVRVLIICHLATGVLIWLFARPAFHIGASGVVYALVLFLLTSGFIRQNRQLKILALVVLSIQTGLIWGIVPQDGEISWESHLFGAIIGALVAFMYKNKGPLPDSKINWKDEEDEGDEYSRFGT